MIKNRRTRLQQILLNLGEPLPFEEFENLFFKRYVVTLSSFITLYTRGFASNDLEIENAIDEVLPEDVLYGQLLEEIYAKVLPATPDIHVHNRFWVNTNDLWVVIVRIYQSTLPPSENMRRFIVKWLSEEPRGFPAAIARELLKTDEYIQKGKAARDENSIDKLNGIGVAIKNNRGLDSLLSAYYSKSKAKKDNARDTLTKAVKKEMFDIVTSKEFNP